MNDLTTKYRPKSLNSVLGQERVVASLRDVLIKKSARSFLFTGPSGTGKTTLARIIASEVGCKDVTEIDAATNSGVDEMRAVTERLNFRSMTGSALKMVIVDECHALSKQAWQSLLKSIEEPPEHVYWCLATTEGDKVPETIRTRCARYDLQPLSDELIYKLLEKVAKAEGLTTPTEVLAIVSEKAKGSPRWALSALSACAASLTRKDALALLRDVDIGDKDIVDLCRLFAKGRPTWEQVVLQLKKIDLRNPESVRVVFCRYYSSAAIGRERPPSPRSAAWAMEILSAFEKPYPTQSGPAPLLLSLGRLVFTE